jgi:GT2 family glycosyltransferase
VLLKRELVDLIGYLDEGYEKGNFEDDDYCMRARMAGYKLAIAKNSFVYHHGTITFKKNRISHSQYMERNRERFYKKAGRIATYHRYFTPHHLGEKHEVSVIIRTKDRPALLQRALTSMANQTFKNFEVVLVNDGGEDVGSFLNLFESQFHIRYVRNAVSKGRTAAVNTGFENSTGKWISYLDDDDILYPWHLESLFLAAESGKNKFVYSDFNRALFLNSKTITPDILNGAPLWEYSRKELLIQNHIPIHTWLYARECAEKVGLWDESLDRLEDYDFLLRLSANYSFYHLKKVTCEYRYYVDSANSIYTDRYRTLVALEKIYQQNPVDDSDSRFRRQDILDAMKSQIQKIQQIQSKIGLSVSEDIAIREIIRMVVGL